MSSTRSVQRQDGYSLLEVLVAVTLVGLLSAMTVVQIGSVRPGLQSDGAMRRVMAELNAARETAISQRRLIEVTFQGSTRVIVTRHEIPNGATVLLDVPFEGGVQYGLVSGVVDTPDAFGNSSPVSFGAATRVMFNTEGMLVDAAGLPVNGTVFLAIPNQPLSLRAVTVLGTTGRVRGFKWNGGQWTRV